MRRFIVAGFLTSTFVLLCAFTASAEPDSSNSLTCRGDFRAGMNKLWEDHATWTRNVIISSLANLPDKDAVTARLLKNQVDIGNAVKPFYGVKAGEQLSLLLKEHIVIASEVIAAAPAPNALELNAAKQRWIENADLISSLLSTANPRFWPVAHTKAMMREHLTLTAAQVTARLQSNWTADVAAYDKIHTQILSMSKMLADGIIRQFPARFAICN